MNEDWQPYCGAESVSLPLRVCVLDEHPKVVAHEDEDGSRFWFAKQVKV